MLAHLCIQYVYLYCAADHKHILQKYIAILGAMYFFPCFEHNEKLGPTQISRNLKCSNLKAKCSVFDLFVCFQ